MSWNRVLCLYPYSPNKKSEQLYGGMAIINPIGLEVVATMAARHAEVLLVDMRLEKRPLADLINEFQPDLIALSLNWGRDAFVDKVVNSLPHDITLIAGGIAVTNDPDHFFDSYPHLDIVALGYGEQTMEELVLAGSPVDVKGLAYRQRAKSFSPAIRPTIEDAATAAGHIVRNQYRYDVDVSNFHVNRKLRRYSYPFLSMKGDNVATSIGCPMVCAFCGWRTNIYGEVQKWIAREPEDVVDEIAETESDIVHIVDANFAHDTKRVERICDLLIERGIKRLLACEIRVNSLAYDVELVKKMERAGFFMFMVGVESTDDRILKRLRKGYTTKMCRRAFDNLRQTHIITLGNFLIGAPGTTEDEMLYVADYAHELGLDFISPNKIYAYPNSAFRNWVMEHPGYHIEGRRGYVVSDKIGLKKLRQIQRKIYFRFFTLPHVLRFYRKAMSHPMVLTLGRERVKRAILRTAWNHIADPRFRRRAIKKLFGRFDKKKSRRQPATAASL